MLPRSQQELFRKAEPTVRFGAEDARRILERAAAEHYWLRREYEASYSLAELEEMAAEAGISREALRRAIDERADGQGGRARWSPRQWSRGARLTAIASLGGLSLLGVLVAFPTVAYAFFWLLVVLSVMILLGAGPS